MMIFVVNGSGNNQKKKKKNKESHRRSKELWLKSEREMKKV